MKKFILLALMAIVTMGAYAQNQSVVIKTNASLNCDKCINRFKENVPFFKGVKTYTYDAKTAVLTINYDSKKTNPDQIRQQISKLGYDADNVKADAAARAKLPDCCKGVACGHNHGSDQKCQGAAKSEHKCQGQNGEHKCKNAAAGEHKCQGQNGQHQCKNAANSEHKCQGQNGQHQCKNAANGEHKCQGQNGEHKCKNAANGEHKCQGQNGQHQCKNAANGEHKCQGNK